LSISRLRPRRRPSRFPYTTLFRSRALEDADAASEIDDEEGQHEGDEPEGHAERGRGLVAERRGGAVEHQRRGEAGHHGDAEAGRSEEHTSELQSPCNLVCRLLLEK